MLLAQSPAPLALNPATVCAALAAPQYTDDQLRALWRDAGGAFHGPRIETGTMPEAALFRFLRRFAAGVAEHAVAAATAYPDPQVPTDLGGEHF